MIMVIVMIADIDDNDNNDDNDDNDDSDDNDDNDDNEYKGIFCHIDFCYFSTKIQQYLQLHSFLFQFLFQSLSFSQVDVYFFAIKFNK